ncbi:hypothetical protein [Oryzibacter oryziterrae]|uniref:hypothetical protein n=1 Tax=Oryzibacter oryziterrae TaxID=2766474 RepID=UPI001F171D0C|nr:hypothetical protein [Oryzibacter oryziterrae]
MSAFPDRTPGSTAVWYTWEYRLAVISGPDAYVLNASTGLPKSGWCAVDRDVILDDAFDGTARPISVTQAMELLVAASQRVGVDFGLPLPFMTSNTDTQK